jgi:hypothetical protein
MVLGHWTIDEQDSNMIGWLHSLFRGVLFVIPHASAPWTPLLFLKHRITIPPKRIDLQSLER